MPSPYTGTIPEGPVVLTLAPVPGAGPLLAVGVVDPGRLLVVQTQEGPLQGILGLGDAAATLSLSDGGSAFSGGFGNQGYSQMVFLTLSDVS